MNKSIFKKTPEQLEEHLSFRNKASVVRVKKGKGSFKRKPKHKNQMFDKI